MRADCDPPEDDCPRIYDHMIVQHGVALIRNPFAPKRDILKKGNVLSDLNTIPDDNAHRMRHCQIFSQPCLGRNIHTILALQGITIKTREESSDH